MIVLGVILLSFSCIEQFDPKLDEYESDGLIVVEGQITDEVGPFRVKLSKTFEVDNMQLYGQPVLGADVQIFDDKGNQYPLFYAVEGWYETENKTLRGVVGNTYTLNITLADGTQYESTPVLMQDVPEIGSIYFKDENRFHFDGYGYKVDEKWLNILVDSKDPTGQTKYWKWEFEETWEVIMPKDSARLIMAGGGFIVVNLEFMRGNIRYGWDNKKDTCWVTIPSTSILVESTSRNSINEVKQFCINSIAPNDDRLHIKYSILVKQTALCKELYDYWKQLKDFNEESGSIYDKVPSQVYGNIRCCNSSANALGYFSASAIKTKRIFITPHEHDIATEGAYERCGYDAPWPWLVYYGTVVASKRNPGLVGAEIWSTDWCSDCRLYAREMPGGSTSKRPDFW